jgi:N-acetylmuramoyl-L-alanine amidase
VFGLLLAAALLAAPAPAFLAVIDPGHGGEQEGAQAPDGRREKDLTLQIARRVAVRLRRAGARATLTRTADTSMPLAERAALANSLQADLFVSIHLNSMPTAATRRASQGMETYFLSADATDASASAVAARENADRLVGEAEPGADDPVAGILQDLENTESLAASSRLAYAIQEKLVAQSGAQDRGVKQAPFYVLAGARMPAVLVELGFISHGAESKKLRDPTYQERIAGAIVDGIAAWRRGNGSSR